MATASRPPHTFSSSYVPRSRPASPALPSMTSTHPRASTSSSETTRQAVAGQSSSSSSSTRPKSTPASPILHAHQASKSSPLVTTTAQTARSSPIVHPLPMKPNSPAMTPRLNDRSERRGSGLKHELRDGQRSEKKKPVRPTEDKEADDSHAILKILSSLPAPLPETLPSTFLPTPRTTPSPTQSFSDWAKSSKRRRSLSDDSLASSAVSSRSAGSSGSTSRTGVGLGLGLSLVSEDGSASSKKRRLSSQSSATAKTTRKSEWSEENSMATWTKEKWTEMGKRYRDRAISLKRLGDAYLRYAGAKPEYLARAREQDPLRGLLCLTDSILMWLFAYWCEEQIFGRTRPLEYQESKPLRDHVRAAWEGRMRRSETEVEKEAAKGMVGLMYLIEAVISYHTSSDHLSQLSRKGRQLDPAAVAPPTPTQSHSGNSTSSSGAADSKPTDPSPPAIAASPALSGHSAESQASHTSSNPLNDLLPLIASSTSSSSSAQHHLLNSRHHLSLGLLRTRFPQSFELATHSELADQALPAPGDTLGSAKRLDIDNPDVFAWPIELGMHAPVAHTAVFGRCLVNEYGEARGGWNVRETA
ncbi:hypothetical protein BD324DRAFT_647397 [Kockovaella imperatae]|uniref:Uncharacterized protein n=1 Tax=Kockovaella imperatae TaxID=4999 RepID=A0A1Y1USR3_9TREE|nr:hypothetical protein BD324DRAFT_647397 [Kockovaella imperatae]ORX40466.1 hypothetical protein BD324DRAFT_647397 [Kockovaella imperatae]